MNTPCKIQCPECGLQIFGFWGKPGEIRKKTQCPLGLVVLHTDKCGNVWDAKLIAAFEKPMS